MNFLRLCELLVKKCPNLKAVDLLTSPEPQPSNHREQTEKLQVILIHLDTKTIYIVAGLWQLLFRHLQEIILKAEEMSDGFKKRVLFFLPFLGREEGA